MVKFLIAHGAHIEARDKEGHNALFWAVNFGQIVTTKYLLEHYGDKLLSGRVNLDHLVGAAINASPSHCAAEMAEECSILILRAMGSRAAPVLLITDGGKVPLLTCVIAIKRYSKKLIKAVLDSGADPNGKFIIGDVKFGSTIEAATFLDYLDAVEALLETKALNVVDVLTSLAYAVKNRHDSCIAALLRGGGVGTKFLSEELLSILVDSEVVRRYVGVVVPPFTLTTTLAKHINQLETTNALRFDDQRTMEYFYRQLPNRDGPLVRAYLSKLSALLTEAPSTTIKYAGEIRKIVIAAHVGSAKRIEDEKRGLRRAINELAKIVAREFDWYEVRCGLAGRRLVAQPLLAILVFHLRRGVRAS